MSAVLDCPLSVASQRADTASVRSIESLPDLPDRSPDGHKGTFGDLGVIAGSPGMLGAAILVVRAAYRTGAGYVRALVPEDLRNALTLAVPPVVTIERTSAGLAALAEHADAYVVGPGLGTDSDAERFLAAVLAQEDRPSLVLDADALNLLAPLTGEATPSRPALGPKTVLTPHPGEAGRLLGIPASEVQADREAAVTELQRRSGAVVVLKGAATLVCDGERLFTNPTGNSGLGTAGSGDVLAGILGALLASGQLEPFDAACLAVHLHGAAGDLAARRWSERGLCAEDLPDALAAVLLEREAQS